MNSVSVINIKDLTDSREVMMKKAPLSVSLFIYIIIAVLLTAFVWSWFGHIDKYVKASGEVRPNDSVATLTAGTGGKIEKMNFQDGDRVAAGDVVLSFDANSIVQQKQLFLEQLEMATSKMSHLEKLKQSVESGKNLFTREPDEEPYYYQYENYITTLQAQVTQIKTSNEQVDHREKELELSLETAKTQLSENQDRLTNYQAIYDAISENHNYVGSNKEVLELYQSFVTEYEKTEKGLDLSLDTTTVQLDENETRLSDYLELYHAISYGTAYRGTNAQLSDLYNSFQSEYEKASKELRLSLNATTDQLSDNGDLLDAYQELHNAIATQSSRYTTSNSLLTTIYNSFMTEYDSATLLFDSYKREFERAQEQLENAVGEQAIALARAALNQAKYNMDSAEKGIDAIVNKYLFDINSNIEKIKSNFSSLENQEKSYNLQLDENLKLIKNKYLRELSATVEDLKNNTTKLANQQKSYQIQASNDPKSVKNKYLLQIISNIEELKKNISTVENQEKSFALQLELLTYNNTAASLKEKAKAEFFVSINNTIDTLQSEVQNLKNQLINIEQSSENAIIFAQSTGTLVLSQEVVAGDFVSAGSALGTIVPEGEQLKVILYIPESNISEMNIGQNVEYTVNAISLTDYGKIRGRILSISADSFVNQASNQKFYKAEAVLDTTTLTNSKGESVSVQTGMLLEARIITGSQRILSWVLDKLNLSE